MKKIKLKISEIKTRAFKQSFFLLFLLLICALANAQGSTAGIGAIEQVARDIKAYIPSVQMLIYAIAGVVALGGGVSVFIKMNNEEQDVKKSIMLLVGACIFLIAAAQALPLFFA